MAKCKNCGATLVREGDIYLCQECGKKYRAPASNTQTAPAAKKVTQQAQKKTTSAKSSAKRESVPEGDFIGDHLSLIKLIGGISITLVFIAIIVLAFQKDAVLGISFLALAVYILFIVAEWRIFAKAGEAGWKSLVPLMNIWVLFRIVWGKGIYCLLALIPVVDIVILIIHDYKFAKAYGYGIGMFLLLMLFPPIAQLIIAFGKSEYIGAA